MPIRTIAGLALLLLVLLASLPSAFCWGDNADRLITNKAVDSLPQEMQPFFEANRQFLVQHVTDPEFDSKTSSSHETDYIRLDHYGRYPFADLPRSYNAAVQKFGKRPLEKYGLLPWQIGLYSKRLTDAFQVRDWNNSKLIAAALAHYVASAHDPFNTTVDEDGRLSGQPGVNERFGTSLVDRYQLFFFIKPNDAVFIHDPTDHAFNMALSAHSWLENVLLADRRAHQGLQAYNDEFYDRFYAQAGAVLIRQFSDAASDVGSYWMTAWINAGRPALPQ
jgi:hypothetical protein